jgi:hypothetical protein
MIAIENRLWGICLALALFGREVFDFCGLDVHVLILAGVAVEE